ncbi:MAG: hypothetical protein OK457_05140 [Thaumarchaeota archaeon]|nr:hypothetical protein [Nitrososphaerota archaeon]
MAKTEQKFVIDRAGLEHLIAMLRDGLEKGASDRQLREQTWEILDSKYGEATERSLKEMKEGNLRRFKTAEALIKELESD